MQNPPIIFARHRPNRIGWIVGALLMALAVLLYRFDPAQSSFYPRCAFYAVTGYSCPGCGATRGLHALLHGHWLAAARLNALLFPVIPFVTACWFALRRFGWKEIQSDLNFLASKPWVFWLAGAFLVLFGILRNLPLYPFNLLAPSGLPN